MLYSLQIGRALAAIAVVVHHCIVATQAISTGTPPFLAGFIKLGYLGVDYFFVLSGFIIAHVTRDMGHGVGDAKRYCISRALRIYIPYLPVALGLFAMFAVMQHVGMGEARTSYSLTASLLLVPSNELPALSVAWSLQHEIVFYILFGVCFFLFKDARFIFLWAAGIIGLLCFTVTDRWLNVVLGIINLEFLFGISACYLYHNKKLFFARYWLLMLGAALVGLASYYLLMESEVAHYHRLIAGLGFACIVLGLVYLEASVDFSRCRLLVFLGAASYAIYLVHAPLISIMIRLPVLLPHWSLTFVALSVISAGAGVLYFKLIETPLMRIARRFLAVK